MQHSTNQEDQQRHKAKMSSSEIDILQSSQLEEESRLNAPCDYAALLHHHVVHIRNILVESGVEALGCQDFDVRLLSRMEFESLHGSEITQGCLGLTNVHVSPCSPGLGRMNVRIEGVYL